MKICRKCATTDPLAFSQARQTICSPCNSAESRAWKLANPKKTSAHKKKWRENHQEQIVEYRQDNSEKINAASRKWRKENPGAVNAHSAKRRASQLQQTPSWSETKEIAELYSWAAHLQKVTGIQMHVDHVVPLQGKHVSGLHCVDNLKVITAKENLTKGNKHESD